MNTSSTIAGGPTPLRRPPFQPGSVTVANAAHVIAIQQLLHRYCHALDHDSAPASVIANMFSENGILCAAYESEKFHEGRPAIEAWYASYLASTRSSSRIRRHVITTSRIEVQNECAWAFSYLDASGIQLKDNNLAFYIGAYEDELVLLDGQWFFASRRITLDYTYAPSGYALSRNGKQAWEGQPEA